MMKGRIASPSSILGAVEFDRLLDGPSPLRSPHPRFDLSHVHLVTPGALVAIAAACHHLAQARRRPTLVVPDPSVRSYLLRAGLAQAVPSVVLEPPMLEFELDWPGFRSGGSRTLLPLSLVRSIAEICPLLNQVVETLCRELSFAANDACDIALAVSELLQNARDHGDGCGAFIAMQVYSRGGSDAFLELGVADHGPGLLQTLRQNIRHGHLRQDADAILLATKLGVSRLEDATRGTGLHHLLRLSEKHRARLQIRSGRAAARFRMDIPRTYTLKVPWMPGTQVALSVNRPASP